MEKFTISNEMAERTDSKDGWKSNIKSSPTKHSVVTCQTNASVDNWHLNSVTPATCSIMATPWDTTRVFCPEQKASFFFFLPWHSQGDSNVLPTLESQWSPAWTLKGDTLKSLRFFTFNFYTITKFQHVLHLCHSGHLALNGGHNFS